MKGKKYFALLSFIGILALGSGIYHGFETPVDIDNISIQSGTLTTKVLMKSASPLSIQDSFYLKDSPATIGLYLTNTQLPDMPEIAPGKNSLVNDIRIEKSEGNKLCLLIDVKEKVPYRIYADNYTTVVELNRFQNNRSDYELEPELKSALENESLASIYLKDIKVSENQNRVDVKATLTGRTIPHVFVLNNPLRLVVDLHNTLASRQATHHAIGKAGINKVRTAQFQVSDPYTITRMVFDLKEPKLYAMQTNNNELTVSFYGDPAPQPEPEKPAPPKPKEAEATIQPEPEKPIIQEKPEKPVPPPPAPTEVPVSKDIGLPNGKAANGNGSNHTETQEGQFAPRTIEDETKGYSGEPLSLKFSDADLQAVIFYLAEFAGLNVTLDPGVTGTVSVSWVDVPWDQALDLILKQNKMGYTIEGNILRVAPIGVLTRESEEQRRLKDSQELSGAVITRIFKLSYSKASEVESLLRNRISDRAEILIDERTNTLIISEVEDRMQLLENLIEVFDTATPQVSIEARIVEATSTFIRNLGVQWGWRGISDPFYGNQTSLKFPNRVISDGAMIPQGIVTKGIGGPLGGYGINLPAPAFSTALGLSMSNVLDTFRIDMALTALETSGSGRIISAPKVTTQNNKEAEIVQGRQIPVQTVANFTVTTRYVNAALELRATPQITNEGTIIMTINIRNNAADFANLVNGIPPITTQSASTTVMIPDGGTTVIGGIYRTEDSITRERVPFFHKIPILGNLFKSFARTKQNRELLIFITPRIIK